MSKSSLDRTVKAMVALVEDLTVPSPQRVKAADTIRQLLKLRPPKKRRSAALTQALKNLGVKPSVRNQPSASNQ